MASSNQSVIATESIQHIDRKLTKNFSTTAGSFQRRATGESVMVWSCAF